MNDDRYRSSDDQQQPYSAGDGVTVWPGVPQTQAGGAGMVPPAPPSPPVPPSPPAQPPYAGFGEGGAPAPVPGPEPEPRSRRRARRPLALFAAVAIVAGAVGGGSAVLANELTGDSASASGSGIVSGSNASAGSSGISAVAEAVSPSVVEIEAVTGAGKSIGSGVVITKGGEILTNNHVISGATDIKVKFSDGSSATAEVVGTDPDHDMALIKAQGKNDLKPATLGDSDDLKVGDQVVAIGSPEGLSGSVTSGIVSALDRDVTVQKDQDPQQQDPQGQGQEWPFGFGGEQYNGKVGGDTTTYKAIQTDASINHGNSGGALVNMKGEIVGINSAMYSSSNGGGGDSGSMGLGFSIPVNDVKKNLDELRNN
ncbi:trypsin-like serine protease [Streptomyces sp. A7024]|uniref:Trypsin-like serine protease n=1 Tax=Streptomyces coryli TaxID=1128680 RepID=A0A6G4U526_9ACTN|nr:trypsin-like peptidase domain-containing protein [Streptomyces coryli]NGN66816.1 trypsin-like serine protease [Streptomyces coryli]